MKKLLTLLSLLVVAIGSFAQTFTVDGLEYTVLSEDDKTVQVSNGKNATGAVVIPETVTDDNGVEYNVIKIGWSAFEANANITSIDMPSVTSIDGYAFNGCTSLSSVSLPAATSIGSYAFNGCSKISSLRIGSVEQWCNVNFGGWRSSPTSATSQSVNLYIGDSETPATEIVVPSTVTEIPNDAFCNTTITSLSAPRVEIIGNSAFEGCTSLSSVSLPVATSIGSYAFNGCRNISSLRIGSVEQWCNVNFEWWSGPLQVTSQSVNLFIGDSDTPATEIVVPHTVTKIPDFAFSGTTITSFSAPAVATVGHAFAGCSSLSSVELPVATSIGHMAFYNCTSLSSVSLPAVTSISNDAFHSCTSLSSVSLPVATSIGNFAFYGCESLEEAIMPKVETIGENAFAGDSYWIGDVYGPHYCTSLKRVDLSSVKTIGNSAFYKCSTLSSLLLPVATSIGNNAFFACESLEEAIMPKVETIGENAFAGDSYWVGDVYGPHYCVSLKHVDMSSVKSIGYRAFNGCNSLDIVHLNDTPPILASTESIPTGTMLAVPDEAYETYLATDVYKDIPLQITKEGCMTKDVVLEADNTTSELLQTIGEDEVKHVVNLKITGSINSYDMLIIRNQMPSLRNLDLTDASIVDCDYVYSNADGVDYHSQKDVVTGEWLSGVMNIKLPLTTKSIGYKAFYTDYDRISRLVSVTIPDGVTSIGDYAFQNCNNISNLVLPQTVTSFGYFAFDGCTGLRKVVIPDGVTTIGSCAFRGCRDLEEVVIPACVTNMGDYVFGGVGDQHYFEIDGVSKWEFDPITLRIKDLDSWRNIDFDGIAFSNVGKLYVGDSEEPVEEIVIPEGTTEIKGSTFAGFKCLKNFTLPEGLTSIGAYAFSGCSGLTEITLPENLSSVGSYAFNDCYNLEKIELPPYLKTIDGYAFQDCSKLKEVLIPASIQEIGDYAFSGCPNLNTVIATTVEPVKINQNTFATYQTATLYSPKTSYYKYYWNTQYNQFLAKKEYDKEFAKTFGYKYFYLNGQNGDQKEDLTIDNSTGVIHGEKDEATGEEVAPDADFNEGAGVIVGGEQIQNLGDIHIHHNGNNGASVIAKNSGKVHIDNLYVDIKTQPNRWYFFCFPFDINPGEATFNGSHVWYLYDGAARALNGNGGWKKIAADGVMKSGNGYIFQGAVNGTLTIHVQDITIDTDDSSTNMITYQSDNKNDASWNLIGNSNFAYYDIDNLDYDAPITVYNNETGNYDAVRASDDDCELYPFQAFFVQKPENTEAMNFDNSKKETKNKADNSKAAKAAARAKAPKKVNPMRKVINLELATVDADAEATATAADRTRIVVNPTKSTSYETDCDAAKFIADNMPQIYSLDNEGAIYSINERPVGNGIINLAVKAPKDGVFTISAARLDCAAKLRDLETGTEVDLAEGGYTFAAEAGTFANRFQLILGDGATAITTPEEAKAAISVEAGAISVNNANADVKIYSVGGALVGSQKGAGSINVPAGAYVVKVNGQSVKVTVNE